MKRFLPMMLLGLSIALAPYVYNDLLCAQEPSTAQPILLAQAYDATEMEQDDVSAQELATEESELKKAKEAMQALEPPMDSSERNRAPSKGYVKPHTRAEAFIAGPEWEFDGFVSGGQDQKIKSMFVLNDLIYLNVGRAQGIVPGDRVSVFRRGDRIRDSQTGRFLGFEVRRAAVAEVTNKVEDETCAARVIKTFEGVEIGDLIRKEE